MIECNVTATGTISGATKMRTNRTTGEAFMTFDLLVSLAKDGDTGNMYISVSMPGKEENLADFPEGRRITVKGMLTMRKVNKIVYYNMSRATCESSEQPDGVSGKMDFRGTLGREHDIERKTDRKGNEYTLLAAYSSSKNESGEYSYIWQKFILFSPAPEWLQPQTGVSIEADMNVSVYNKKPDIHCRVTNITPWTPGKKNQTT